MAKFTFLGTGTSTGIPLLGCQCHTCSSPDPRDHRLRSSAFLEIEGHFYTIDCGPDFRQQLLRVGVSNLSGILFTHGHRDHTAGLDDIRAINFIHDKALPIYLTEELLEQLKFDFRYMFDENNKYPGVGEVEIHHFDNKPFFLPEDVTVQPIPVWHGHLPVHGFRIGNLAYITDASIIPEKTWPLLEGIEILIINALRDAPHHSHFTVAQAIEISEQLGNPTTYFTHIAHQFGRYAERNPQFPSNIQMAYDGLTIEFDPSWT
jgi:phosphoribosyl 1,2-cyclic phosphate phosphodiesterase